MVPKSDWGWQEYQGPSDPTAAPAGAPRVGCPGHVQAAFEYFQERHSTASGYLVPVPNHQNVSVKYTKNPIIRRCQQLLKKKKNHNHVGTLPLYQIPFSIFTSGLAGDKNQYHYR